jgi:uncharacterized membrane protein YphA (DoxX/SURF4 family)
VWKNCLKLRCFIFYPLFIMKKDMCDRPAHALMLMRIGVALLFLIPGIMKLMMPGAFQASMVEGGLGLGGAVAPIVTWLIIIAEVGGGLALLLGSKVPRCLYNLSAWVLLIITLTAMLMIRWQMGAGMDQDWVYLLMHVLTILCLLGLSITNPRCACSITGSDK